MGSEFAPMLVRHSLFGSSHLEMVCPLISTYGAKSLGNLFVIIVGVDYTTGRYTSTSCCKSGDLVKRQDAAREVADFSLFSTAFRHALHPQFPFPVPSPAAGTTCRYTVHLFSSHRNEMPFLLLGIFARREQIRFSMLFDG